MGAKAWRILWVSQRDYRIPGRAPALATEVRRKRQIRIPSLIKRIPGHDGLRFVVCICAPSYHETRLWYRSLGSRGRLYLGAGTCRRVSTLCPSYMATQIDKLLQGAHRHLSGAFGYSLDDFHLKAETCTGGCRSLRHLSRCTGGAVHILPPYQRSL